MRESFKCTVVAIALGSILGLAGCSNKGATTSTDTTAPVASPAVQSSSNLASAQSMKAAAAPTVSNIQNRLDQIQNDPNMPAAQKAILMQQGQHALTMAQSGTAP